MPHFIKTGLWFKSKEGHKGSLDLENLIKEIASSSNYHDFNVSDEPSAPPSGKVRLWMDLSGSLMIKDHSGTVKEIQNNNPQK